MELMDLLPLTRRSLLAAAAGLSATYSLARSLRAAVRPVVVELFTSQGCSSCPPADAFMGDLVGKDGIIAVSLNVDYWDYIGWRDTLASPQHTRRQRAYAAKRRDGRVYTPQMVINGRRHAVGSDPAGVLQLIERERREALGNSVDVSMTEHGGEILIRAGRAGRPELRRKSTLTLMAVTPEVTVEIERGENAGSTITYYNVARSLKSVGSWRGDEMELRLARHSLSDGKDGCVGLLQVDDTGYIAGAAAWRLGNARGTAT
jgi:hypothetical protein